MRNPELRVYRSSKQEYTVEFACVSTYRVCFKAVEGMTDRQVLQKAKRLANATFKRGGIWNIERNTSDGYFCFAVLGIDRSTGQVVDKPAQPKPRLILIKNEKE